MGASMSARWKVSNLLDTRQSGFGCHRERDSAWPRKSEAVRVSKRCPNSPPYSCMLARLGASRRSPVFRSFSLQNLDFQGFKWRRGWDSNPRDLAALRFSRPAQSTTLPPLLVDFGVSRPLNFIGWRCSEWGGVEIAPRGASGLHAERSGWQAFLMPIVESLHGQEFLKPAMRTVHDGPAHLWGGFLAGCADFQLLLRESTEFLAPRVPVL
jgi:hypothetical protein